MQPIPDAGWRFDNSYARLPASLFAAVLPSRVPRPMTVILNEPLAAEMGLDPGVLGENAADNLSGNDLPPGAEPIAQAYAGHQFGHFTNLGDGRAILLGEQLTPDGGRLDVQLKGSGRTRYSRGGDGRAALGPMLREYIISEAMHALGVPTTRSLAVVSTGQEVLRTTPLPGAILTRVASSHIRVGTFQFAAAIDDREALSALLAHSIARHAPEAKDAEDPAVAFFEAVVERQASLVAGWMLLGFVHGVMNTDNMAVSGETIDYGPCAFLDSYAPDTVFSSIDHHGRYAFANQPSIAQWNLARLAESLLPLVHGDEAVALDSLRRVFATFPEHFERYHLAGARKKLGLVTQEPGDGPLFDALLGRMHASRADFTVTFASLAELAEPVAPSADQAVMLGDWLDDWRRRLQRQSLGLSDAVRLMRSANPLVIPRNHRVEEALAAAEAGDFGVLRSLLEAIRHPFDCTPAHDPYRFGPPAGCGRYRTFCGT